MRIKIEIEGDQVSVKTDDAKRIDEDQEAEKSWFRDVIGHKLKDGETLSGEGLFAFKFCNTPKLLCMKNPHNIICEAYYKLPPLPELESSVGDYRCK